MSNVVKMPVSPIERLRAQKEAHEKAEAAAEKARQEATEAEHTKGQIEGYKWAENKAEYIQLEKLSGTWSGSKPEHFLQSKLGIRFSECHGPISGGIGFTHFEVGMGDAANYFSGTAKFSPNFLTGWIAGAKDFYAEVKDHL